MYRLLGVLLFISLIACRDEVNEDQTLFLSTPFFPLELDHTLEYEVTEISLRQGGRIKDSLTYMMRTSVREEYHNNVGDKFYLVDQAIKINPEDPYRINKNWTAQIANNELIEDRDNLPLVKMKLPLRAKKEWNPLIYYDNRSEIFIAGERMNYFKNWGAKIIETNGSFNGYDKVMTIELANFENRLERRYYVEKYAENIGLIYREILMIDSQCFDNCESIAWINKGERGHHIIQILKK